MSEDLRELIEDLAAAYPDGTPVLVLIDDYLERAKLAVALAEEADLYGIEVFQSSTLEDAQQRWPTREGNCGRAALALIETGAGEHWAPWLEANREALPQWMRFVQHDVAEPGVGRGAERRPMSYGRTSAEAWTAWREVSRGAAAQRWAKAEKIEKLTKSGKRWFDETRTRLVHLTELGILAPREQTRIAQLDYGQLASADQQRLDASGLRRRNLFAFAVAPEDKDKASERLGAQAGSSDDAGDKRLARSALTLNPGKYLQDGKLSFQVFIDDHAQVPLGMNIQLRGIDPMRKYRPVYLRYDLDVVQMGEKAGPVTHFQAHWHTGDDPDAGDAEDHDPRLPSLPLDPLAVIEILIEMFFPNGPDDVEGVKEGGRANAPKSP